MQLPNAEFAWIHPDKLINYLLDPAADKGGGKAAFFTKRGFTPENWRSFEAALLHHARNCDVVEIVPKSYGMVYVLEGDLPSPDGRTDFVRSIWMIDTGQSNPRLLSAYPRERRRRK